MKKKIAICLSFVMVLSMCFGCGKKTSKYLMNIDYSDYVTVCEYKGVPASKVTFEVSEEEVKQRVQDDLYAYVTYDPINDRSAKLGDYINMDYKGSIDGVELAEYTDSDIDILLGEGYFFEDAENDIEGMKTGEEKKIDIVLDESTAINETDIGKELSLQVVVNQISVEHLPEYNDDFVTTNMNFDSMQAYEESLKKDLENEKTQQYKSAAIEEMLRYLYDNSVFDKYPQELYDQCEEDFNSFNSACAEQYDMELDEYLELYGIDEEAKNEILIEEVNNRLIICAIAQAENIDCEDDELETYVQNYYEDYGFESPEDFQQQYTEMQIGYEVIFEKVTDFLYENATFTTISEEDYYQQMEDVDMEELEDVYYDDSELVDEPLEIEEVEINDESEENQDESESEETTEEE